MATSTIRRVSSRILLPLGIGLATYATVLARGSALLSDPDVYLHIAVGRWIIAHGSVPHEDVFSHSMRGAPWVPHEWLSEVILASSYDQFGWLGLVVLSGMALALTLALLVRALLDFLAPAYALIGATTAWGMCLPSLLARPHLLVYPLLVAWVASLVAARNRDRAPSPFVALMMVLWANLHGSFVIGLMLAALFAAEALFEANDRHAARRVVLTWGAFGLLSFAAAFATPNGAAGALLPLDLVRMNFTLSWINEWKSPDFQQNQPIEVWLMLLLMGGLLLGIRVPITRILMLLILLHMALQHRRHGTLLGLVTPLLMAPALASQLPQRPERSLATLFNCGLGGQTRLGAAGVTVVLMTCVLSVGATVWRLGLTHGAGDITPATALAAVRQNHIVGPVFNDFNFGGYLIFSGVPTFVDGRADMYGDQFIRRYAKREDLPGLLSQYKITWTLLGAEHPAVLQLDSLPGWRRLHTDAVAIVHVREKTAAP